MESTRAQREQALLEQALLHRTVDPAVEEQHHQLLDEEEGSGKHYAEDEKRPTPRGAFGGGPLERHPFYVKTGPPPAAEGEDGRGDWQGGDDELDLGLD